MLATALADQCSQRGARIGPLLEVRLVARELIFVKRLLRFRREQLGSSHALHQSARRGGLARTIRASDEREACDGKREGKVRRRRRHGGDCEGKRGNAKGEGWRLKMFGDREAKAPEFV